MTYLKLKKFKRLHDTSVKLKRPKEVFDQGKTNSKNAKQ